MAELGLDNIRDVEHFKEPYLVLVQKDGAYEGMGEHELDSDLASWAVSHDGVYVHYGVVVMRDGRCYVGKARPNWRDTYNRKLGYTIAIGKALRQAALDDVLLPVPDFADPEGRTSRALRDFCREQLGLKKVD